jgi:hypothetical protein
VLSRLQDLLPFPYIRSLLSTTPTNGDYELVSLVVVPRNIRGDCGGFPMVPGEDIISHFLVPLEGASRGIGTCTRKGWLVEVRVTSSHSFFH